MPYIYSLAGPAHHQNSALVRGLVLDFNAEPAVRTIAGRFLLGPSLLVNPVIDYKARNRKLYLPATTGRFGCCPGKCLAGGQTLMAGAPLEHPPRCVREGPVVPFGPAVQHTAEKPAGPIALPVCAGKGAAFALHEGAGTRATTTRRAPPTPRSVATNAPNPWPLGPGRVPFPARWPSAVSS